MKKLLFTMLSMCFMFAGYAQNDVLTIKVDSAGNTIWKKEAEIFEIPTLKLNASDKLVWQKVYETDLSPEEVFMRINAKGFIMDHFRNGNQFSGRLVNVTPNHQNAKKYVSTRTPKLEWAVINAGFLLEVKDGKYVVTISNMILERVATKLHQADFYPKGELSPIEGLAYHRGKIGPMFLKSYGVIIDDTFDKLFQDISTQLKDAKAIVE